MAVTKDEILEAISKMSVMDVVELISDMEKKFNVTAAAPLAVAVAGGGDAAAAAPAEEQTEFAVTLKEYPADKKVTVIKVIREITGLALKEAKDLVEGAPQKVATIYPYGPFPAGDGKTVMLGLQNEREWQQFCAKVLQQPEVARDARFVGNAARVAHRDALRALILEAFAPLSAPQVLQRLDEAQIANAQVNDMAGLWQHAQLEARSRWREVGSPVGPLPALLPPGSWDDGIPSSLPCPRSVSTPTPSSPSSASRRPPSPRCARRKRCDAMNRNGRREFEVVYSEGMFVVDDAAAAIRDYATQGFDLIIAHGSQYGSSLQEIAPDFPETSFAWGTTVDTFGLPNVFAYEALSQEGGYVNGVLAATLSASKVIGIVGPIETGDAKLYVVGLKAGVVATDPDIHVNVNYIGSFSDVALASEAATTHIAAGADVLTGSAQMVVGAIGKAEEANALWFGTQSNQASLVQMSLRS